MNEDVQPLTLQQVFDNALFGIRRQNYVQSYDDDEAQCVYRSPDGDKCAIGHSIPDSVYHPDMDYGGHNVGGGIFCVMNSFPTVKDLFKVIDVDSLHELQRIHDNFLKVSSETFEIKMMYFAHDHNLTYTQPESQP